MINILGKKFQSILMSIQHLSDSKIFKTEIRLGWREGGRNEVRSGVWMPGF